MNTPNSPADPRSPREATQGPAGAPGVPSMEKGECVDPSSPQGDTRPLGDMTGGRLYALPDRVERLETAATRYRLAWLSARSRADRATAPCGATAPGVAGVMLGPCVHPEGHSETHRCPSGAEWRLRSAEVTWYVETEQPDGTWEQSSATQTAKESGEQCLASLRWRHPDTGHRLMRRTVTTRADQEVAQ